MPITIETKPELTAPAPYYSSARSQRAGLNVEGMAKQSLVVGIVIALPRGSLQNLQGLVLGNDGLWLGHLHSRIVANAVEESLSPGGVRDMDLIPEVAEINQRQH